jgi:simple sugar transport system ATP-binding protein
LGIAGVEGNGQTELVEVLTGLKKSAGGQVVVKSEDILDRTPRKIREKGIAHIPEDRLTNGVSVRESIEENLIVDRYYRKPYKKGLLIDHRLVQEKSNELIKQFGILTPSGKLPVASLSGGNMQKVIVAREFSSDPYVLIASQPTRGIDVGATEFIREELVRIRSNGCAILLVSADLSEVMSLSDRIVTMYEGSITVSSRRLPKLQKTSWACTCWASSIRLMKRWRRTYEIYLPIKRFPRVYSHSPGIEHWASAGIHYHPVRLERSGWCL